MADKAAKKKPNIFVRAGRAIVRFFKDTRGEMKRIVWPSPKQVRNNLIVVLVFVVLFALLVFALDFIFGNLMTLLLDLSRSFKEGAEAVDTSTSGSVAAAVTTVARWFTPVA